MNDIIILGMGPSRCDCPFDSDQVYSCNTGYRQVAEQEGMVSHIFLAHSQVKHANGEKYFNWDEFNTLAQAGVQIFNIHKIKGLNSKMYPLKRISKKFNSEYFSDTIAYMVAYALDQATDVVDGKIVLNGKYNKLRFYGVDMHEFGEYGLEKGGIEYWIGWARGLGMEVEISVGSTLLRTVTGKPYGAKTITIKNLLKGTPFEGKPYKIIPGAIYDNPDTEHLSLYNKEITERKQIINDRKDERAKTA